VGVAAKIGKYLLRACERFFSKNDPGFAPCFFHQLIAVRGQGQFIPFFFDPGKILFFEFLGQGFNPKQKFVITLNPFCLVMGENTRRNQTVNMKMLYQNLAPGVENGKNARLTFKFPLRIIGEYEQGLLYSRKQAAKQYPLIIPDKLVQDMGNGKYNMEITARQQLRSPFIQPLLFSHSLTFRAMSVATGVIAVSDRSAIVAHFLMPAELRSSAHHNRSHYLALLFAHGVTFFVFFTIHPENIRYFIFCFHDSPSSSA